MTFVGNLGDGVIFLISRVRLIDPNESFYTHANHRIRDSHIGRSGHWVDIVVHGPCSDEALELIRRLAQEVDSRPILVRRAAARTNTTHSDDHGRSR
jgi:3-deoxy-D-arabino-heptulosonate 7-phosphate (DAHP) synthase